MPLTPGTKLGRYEIVEPLGAGGMGEVYLARDTRLDRQVAVKVLPEHLADNNELRQRFEHEARAVSSLNHPNICTLHDVGEQDGVHYLVMEHLEGETLAQRLTGGALPFDEAMQIAAQIADALQKAHGKGVVHRDLKPGNIMLTRAGAKLLDFGLAKSVGDAGGPMSSVALTQASPLTTEGAIVGTFQYMSPEQLQGKVADARSDIFSFGAVIYEMITGRRAFEAANQASLIVAIMSTEPPAPSTLAPLAPAALDRLVGRCLAKEPDQRWHSAADLASELKWIGEGGADTVQATDVAPARGGGRERILWSAAVGILLVALIAMALTLGMREAVDTRPMLTTLLPPTNMSFDPKSPVAISPDGLTLAFVAIRSTGVEDAVRGGIWLRALDQAQARLLPGTEEAEYPFWSPDSRWLGFYADGKLYKIDTRDGLAVALCEARDGRGGAWNKDGVILFQERYSQALSRISAGGGTPTHATQLDPSHFDVAHRWPRFLPGGKKFLFYVVSTTNPTSSEHSGIYVGSLDSDETTLIVRGESRGVYAAGHLVYRRGSALMARPFDVDALQFTGDEMPLAGDIPGGAISWGGAYFGVSGAALLIYLKGADATNTDLTWYDRSGNQLGTLGPSAGQLDVRLSHDGTRAVVSVGREAGDLWVHDLTRDVRTRFTFHPADDGQAQWSPDDRFIVFRSSRKSNGELYIRDSSGSNDEELLVETNQHVTLTDWSRDGRHILYSSLSPETDWDLWVYAMEDKEARPFLVKEYDQNLARLSPDGKWVAYSSNESGRTEIYVQAFPDPGGRWMISSNSGDDPIWSADGKELFFLTSDHMLMAVKVETEPSFTVGKPVRLFSINERGTAGGSYDVSADGQRFLVNNLVKPKSSSLGVTVVTNWTGMLDR